MKIKFSDDLKSKIQEQIKDFLGLVVLAIILVTLATISYYIGDYINSYLPNQFKLDENDVYKLFIGLIAMIIAMIIFGVLVKTYNYLKNNITIEK